MVVDLMSQCIAHEEAGGKHPKTYLSPKNTATSSRTCLADRYPHFIKVSGGRSTNASDRQMQPALSISIQEDLQRPIRPVTERNCYLNQWLVC